MIVKSVEHDSDDIVAKDVLALAHMSADLAALIFALHHDVKVLIVKREVSGRRTADWIAVVRLALAKLGNLRFRLTRRVVKKVLELRRPRYSRDVNSRARQGIGWVTLIRSALLSGLLSGLLRLRRWSCWNLRSLRSYLRLSESSCGKGIGGY